MAVSITTKGGVQKRLREGKGIPKRGDEIVARFMLPYPKGCDREIDKMKNRTMLKPNTYEGGDDDAGETGRQNQGSTLP